MASRIAGRQPVSLVLAVILVIPLAACSGGSAGTTGGPDGSGVVTAEPEPTAAIEPDSACLLAEASPTLVAEGAQGVPADTTYIAALAYCTLTLPEAPSLGLSIELVTAADIALVAGVDPAVVGGTLLRRPALGENGYFSSRTPNVDPEADPTDGVLGSARGEYGVVLAWASASAAPDFVQMEQIVRELLEALP